MVSMAPAANPSMPLTNNSKPAVMPDSGMMSAPKSAPRPARARARQGTQALVSASAKRVSARANLSHYGTRSFIERQTQWKVIEIEGL